METTGSNMSNAPDRAHGAVDRVAQTAHQAVDRIASKAAPSFKSKVSREMSAVGWN